MRRQLLLVLSCALAFAGLAAPIAAADAVPSSSALGGYEDMAVDQAHGHVLVSQGADGIAVFDLVGARQSTVGALGETGPMALDGDDLYVALPTTHELVRLDAATFDVLGRWPLGAVCPEDVAVSSSIVWLVDSCGGDDDIVSLDPATGETAVHVRNIYHATLVTSPGRPGVLYVFGTFDSLSYDVGTDPVRLSEHAVGPMGFDAAAISPDGRTGVTTDGYLFDTETLAVQRTLNSGSNMDAVAVQSDGTIAAADSARLFAYLPGRTDWFDVIDIHATTQHDGLAWVDGNLVTAVKDRDGYSLAVYRPTRRSLVTLVPEKHSYRYGDRARLHLTLSSRGQSRTVRVYAQPAQGERQLIAVREVPEGGDAVVAYRVVRKTEFVAEFVGDADTKPDTDNASVGVRVTIEPVALHPVTRVGQEYRYHVGSTATVEYRVRPAYPGDCITAALWVRVQGWHPIGETSCLKLYPGGRVGVLIKGTHELRGYPLRVTAIVRNRDHGTVGKADTVLLRFT